QRLAVSSFRNIARICRSGRAYGPIRSCPISIPIPARLASPGLFLRQPLRQSDEWLASMSVTAVTRENLVCRYDNLDEEQHDDDQLQAPRPLRVDDVGQRRRGFGDDAQLAIECARAFFELVLALQPGIQPFETRAIPQHIWLFGHGDAS